MDGYILCATPRSGSTLLCELLTATGVAGAPDSYFMDNLDPAWAAAWGLPDRAGLSDRAYAAAHLRAAVAAGRAGGAVFGLRLMGRNRAELMALIEAAHPGPPTDRARIEAAFGRVFWIHLSRADRLAQAVSLVRAEQTGLWHVAPDGTEVERLSPPAPPVYDFERIAARHAALAAEEAGWQEWFAAEAITPLRIDYDTLAADPAAQTARILQALGLPRASATRLTPGLARMSDALSQDWIARFRADAARRGSELPTQ